MTALSRRKRGGYFSASDDGPRPVSVRVKRRVAFSDADPMAVLWHGRYAEYFEQANEELGRRCGLSYLDFMRDGLRAPVVQFHVDYFASPRLGEEVTVIGRMFWNEGARINIEYEIRKEDDALAASGYTVQMFVTDRGEVLVASPALIETCRERWANGEFADMQ